MRAKGGSGAVYDYGQQASQVRQTFDLTFARVPTQLEALVEKIICNRSNPVPCSRVPEGVAHVVFLVTRWAGRARRRVGDATLLLSGAHTVRRPMPLGTGETIVAQLRPGAARAIFGVPAHVLANRMVPAEVVWGRSGVQALERIVGATSTTARITEFARILRERVREFQFADIATVDTAARMLSVPGSLRVRELVASSGYSERHLRRMFEECLGLSPKSYAKTLRLRAALQSVNRAGDLAELAAAAGYYDQAHMTHEFRTAIGLTPARLFADKRTSATASFGIIMDPAQNEPHQPTVGITSPYRDLTGTMARRVPVAVEPAGA